jgi:hypothetical protein
MICPTVAVQMNGLGCWFQACMNASIACFKSGTLTKLPPLHVRFFVRAVVVHHQVQAQLRGKLSVQATY